MKSIELRPWRHSDLENLVRYANNPMIAQNMSDAFPYPYTRDHGMVFLEHVLQPISDRIFAIAWEGAAIGSIGIHPKTGIYRKNAELGYWLAEPFWNRGFMTEAILKVVEYAFAHGDIDTIFARPFGHNIASQRCLEKCGFSLEACLRHVVFKEGQYLDQLIYFLRRNVKTEASRLMNFD